jgi:hypothetical protein
LRPQIWSGLPARSPRRFRLERRFEIRDDKPISEIELWLVQKIGVALCPRARGEIGPCWPIRRPAPGVCRRWPEIAWSGERALPGDVPADDEGLDFSSSFVGDQGFHVAQVAHDMEVEQDTVAA